MAAKQCVLVARVTVDGNGQMVEVICDGHDCKVCSAKDSDNDLVFADQAFCWAYVPLPFSMECRHLWRLIQHGTLQSVWGMMMAPPVLMRQL